MKCNVRYLKPLEQRPEQRDHARAERDREEPEHDEQEVVDPRDDAVVLEADLAHEPRPLLRSAREARS